MKKEIWKDIEGYEGYYQVSNLGRVRSLDRNQRYESVKTPYTRKLKGRVLSQMTTKLGYKKLTLAINQNYKNMPVHRLVAKAFLPNEKNLPCVNHINENPSDNMVENLEWCTHKYNSNYGTVRQRISKSNGIPVRAYSFTSNKVYKYDSISKCSFELLGNYYLFDLSIRYGDNFSYKGYYFEIKRQQKG